MNLPISEKCQRKSVVLKMLDIFYQKVAKVQKTWAWTMPEGLDIRQLVLTDFDFFTFKTPESRLP